MTTAIHTFVRNAVEAMPEGGTLRVDLEECGAECVLRFTDTGCGVDEENLDRIFEPFFSTKPGAGDDEVHGTGMGLAMAHGIVHEIGGRIAVRSEVGKGTVFEVYIPIPLEQPPNKRA
jgi:signal transduction histidine kinase